MSKYDEFVLSCSKLLSGELSFKVDEYTYTYKYDFYVHYTVSNKEYKQVFINEKAENVIYIYHIFYELKQKLLENKSGLSIMIGMF